MTFKEQLFASFIGSFFGFIFAIILFFVTNVIINYRNKKILCKHLKREFEYDISLIQEWIDEVDTILRKVTANDQNIYSYLKYSFFQRSFMQQAFNAGIMYNKLNDEEISQLNTILTHCDINLEPYVNSFITQWKNHEINQQAALSHFEFEKGELQDYKKFLKQILNKID